MAKTNKYSSRKSFVCSLFDVALMMANFSQMKTVLDQNQEEQKWYYVLLSCIGLSILLQIVFAVLMLIVWCIERRLEQRCPHHKVTNRDGNSTPQSQTGGTCCIGNTKSKCCSSDVADTLDEIGLFVVFIVIVLNIVIVSFGLTATGTINPANKTQ
ncbi:hypothetical protein FSP39_015255 [Pinctada imbricata]|uniref:Uncharacterized protein n=1 Tax=Pinctada imbricata TaxID=66713 RepID=A0AA88YDB0_PINIB|nr:hypothetical protein FSP39_015255 [Pinctada imbricata]